MALFLATALLWLLLVTPGFDACRKAFGRDFLAFYTAGMLAADGRFAELYDLESFGTLQRRVAQGQGMELGEAIGPWWNPPGYAWVFAPLARLPFGGALLLWTGINLAAACGAAWILVHVVSPRGGSDRLLVALLLLSSAPLLQSITHGQNSAISLLIVSAVAVAWRGGDAFLAGACVGMLAYKPQLAAALGVALVLHRGRRAAAGILVVGCAVVLVTAVTMPGALVDYVHRLPANLHQLQVQRTYLWDRHVTLRAFWQLLLQGRGPGETPWLVYALTLVSAVPLLAGLGFAAIKRSSADALISATVLAAPLLMPFYFDYDLLLLAVAAALSTDVGRRRLAIWAALYLWLFVNPYIAGAARVNLTVPLLYALAATRLWDCVRIAHPAPGAPPAETNSLPEPHPLPRAA